MRTPMTQKLQDLKKEYALSLSKAIGHLEYSYNKVLKLPTDPQKLDEESLETWESFTARLARVVDVFTSKYVRTCILIDDPGFEGKSLRDFMNQAEKLGLLDSADEWMIARGYRNITSHEYKNEALEAFLKSLLDFAPAAILLKADLKN